MKKRVYISGAITGIDNYKEYFARAEQKLIEKGYAVYNPAKLSDIMPLDVTSWEEYMIISIEMLKMCDIIYVLNNWVDSKGAKIEVEFALENNKEIIYES